MLKGVITHVDNLLSKVGVNNR